MIANEFGAILQQIDEFNNLFGLGVLEIIHQFSQNL